MLIHTNDNQPVHPSRAPALTPAPVANSRIAFWSTLLGQPIPRSDQVDLRELDQRVRESGEW